MITDRLTKSKSSGDRVPDRIKYATVRYRELAMVLRHWNDAIESMVLWFCAMDIVDFVGIVGALLSVRRNDEELRSDDLRSPLLYAAMMVMTVHTIFRVSCSVWCDEQVQQLIL